MGRSVMQVSDVGLEIPIADGSADVAISSTVIVLDDEVALDAQATGARIAFTGTGDVRARLDGGTPVGGSSGELWFTGGILKVNRRTFEKLKLIRDGSVDGAVHVTQMTGGKLR